MGEVLIRRMDERKERFFYSNYCGGSFCGGGCNRLNRALCIVVFPWYTIVPKKFKQLIPILFDVLFILL